MHQSLLDIESSTSSVLQKLLVPSRCDLLVCFFPLFASESTVEFLLKIHSGYPMDAGVATQSQTQGIPQAFAVTPLSQLTSLRPRKFDVKRCNLSVNVLEHKETYGQAQVCSFFFLGFQILDPQNGFMPGSARTQACSSRRTCLTRNRGG